MSPAVDEMDEKRYRIYEFVREKPRLRPHHVSKDLGLRSSSVGNLMKETFDRGYIVGPHLRKKSYRNFLEYMYFIKAPEPVDLYQALRKDKRVVYHARMVGFSDLWVTAKESLDIGIDHEIIVEGYRSDYLLSRALNCPWEDSFHTMHNMIDNFTPSTYNSKNYIQTHWDETVNWSETDEILFREFKYNLRKAMEPVMKEYKIPLSRIIKWLKKLPECCTIATSFFPKTISAYDPYIFMFETEYEDFIVDLFSQLPVSTFFFKVSGKLFLDIHVKKELLRNTGGHAVEFDKLQIPLLIEKLHNKGIITSDSYGIVEYFWVNKV